MKPRSRTRLNLEQLEDRWCPSLYFNFDSGGNLNIGDGALQGAPTGGVLNIVQHAGTVDVGTGGSSTNLGVGIPVTGKINIRLNNVGATVNLFLYDATSNNATAGSVCISAGNGNDTVNVLGNNTATGQSVINGDFVTNLGNGKDTVSLDNTVVGKNNLEVRGNVHVTMGNSQFDELDVGNFIGGVQVDGSVYGTNLDTFQLLDVPMPSSVGNNVFLSSSKGTTSASNNYNFFGSIGSTSSVGGSVTISTGGAAVGAFGTTVLLQGTIGGNVYANMGNGNNNFSLDPTTGLIGGNLSVVGGNGIDVVTIAGTLDGSLTASLGAGSNKLLIPAGSTILGNFVNYTGGAGANDVEFAGSAVGAVFNLNLGIGPTNNFTLSPTGVAKSIFINFGPGPHASHTLSLTFGPGINFPVTYINF
jgi:hypothetical protein